MATYYVDPAGSDANAGTHETVPWLTVAKVNAASLVAGDSVLFKRGGTWRGTTLVPVGSGGAGNHITIGAYGSSSSKPVLSGGAVPTGWTVHATNVYKAALTTEPSVVTFNGTRLPKASSLAAIAANQWWWVSNEVYVHLNGTNPTTGTVEAAIRNVVDLNGQGYYTVREAALHYGIDQAVKATGDVTGLDCLDLEVRYCGLVANGGAILANYVNSRVLRCDIRTIDNDGVWGGKSGLEVGWCQITEIYGTLTDGVQLDGESLGTNAQGFNIHDNFIDKTLSSTAKGCIIVNAGTGSSGGTVARNRCIGGNFGIAVATSGTNVVNNYLAAATTSDYAGAGIQTDVARAIIDVTIKRNVVIGGQNAIFHADNTQDRTGWTITNNTFIDQRFRAFWLSSVNSYTGGTIKNNILWRNSGATSVAYRVAAPTGVAADFNIIGPDAASSIIWGGNTYSTLAAYKAANATVDQSSIASDPLTVSTTDARLTTTSPAINAGVALGEGYSGSVSDIGAYEHNPPGRRAGMGVGA